MEKEQRSKLQKATQDARRLLEEEFSRQLLETYDINVAAGRWNDEPGTHLQAEQRLLREKLLAWIEHRSAQINDEKEALLLALREMAFTALNRFVALKLMEARELVRPCVSGGLESEGFQEFTAVAQGLLVEQESSYRLYLETIFEDVSRELRALFDPRDPASLLWPKRTALLELLDILNRPELAELWREDETLGWIYQYFNGDAERKKMREESSAPRNSRELAVRNQFFTPRYVVEFLTDNTLGRIWYEMLQGDTGLKERCRYLVRRPNEIWLQPGGEEAPAEVVADEALSQEELLRQPVHIPHRALKDPREIRMLDPACGSMHFGLYAFDLYLAIYGEAWEIAQGSDKQAKQGEAFAAFVADAAGFADKAAFLREVPRLILQHNIHGVDIDPRATQIARLTLWLRAQRAWQEQGVEVAARPAITRSNVVCAEPMPGERELLADFVDQQFPEAERGLVQQLLETIFDKMQLAGEAGSLLKIEEEIRDAIEQARREWQKLAIQQRDLFSAAELAALGGVGSALNTDLQNLTQDFWLDIEERIYTALSNYAEQAESGGGFQRRLFAEDAAQGFAFIDICRKSYDVALMNPPFGDASLPSKPYIEEAYGDTKGDVYKAFVECFHARLVRAGYLGIISSRTGFFLGQSEDWRTRVVLRLFRPIALADLGSGVLDAMVEVAAYVLRSLSAPEARDLTHSIVPVLGKVVRDSQDRFSLPKWQAARVGLKRHQAVAELEHLEAHGFIKRSPGDTVRYSPLWHSVKEVAAPPEPVFPLLVSVRATDTDEKEGVISSALSGKAAESVFISNPTDFLRIPSCTFCYWISPKVVALFGSLPKVQSEGREAVIGASTKDDFRFLRLAWESQNAERALIGQGKLVERGAWTPFAKGGAVVRYYGDLNLTVNWDENGAELKAMISEYRGSRGWGYQWSAELKPRSFSFRPGVTWGRRSTALAFRVLPENSMFADKGPAILDSTNSEETLLSLLAVLNSRVFVSLTAVQVARVSLAQSFEIGIIQSTPIPILDEPTIRYLAAKARTVWALLRAIDSAKITSNAFALPALLAYASQTLAERAAAWAAHVRTSEETVAAIQAEIDDLAFRLYGLDAVDRAALTSTLATEATGDAEAEAGEDEDTEAATADTPALSADLVGYGLGVAFGRWDIRYATGEQAAPELPDPFAALPVCPPGQLQNAQGLPARPEDVPAAYPVHIPWDGILVDDPNHPLDLEHRIREVIEIIWSGKESGATAEVIEHEACEILGVKVLRDYFRKPAGFFSDHLKRYSKSRRQAPIYWQLSAGNGNYSVWLYYHRFTSDTLYRVLRDFVEPRIQEAEREQFELESQGGLSGDASSLLQEAQVLLQDLRLFKSELELVAPLWNPNLNDGVIINHAILWRITPYTPWQKKCKECWDKLVKGDYDWAHLSFHLWPERVIKKCQSDRSLAIAHGLEERLWQETNKGNWLQRQLSDAELQALIAEHSKPAVQNALERFLAAPPPVAAARTRATRAAKSSSTGSTTRRPRGSAPAVDAEASRQTLLVLTAAPADGLGRNAIAELLDVDAASLTAVIKQLKEGGQIEQLGAARGAKYRLSESGLAAVESQAGEDD
jgi:DNA-binding MarR family transcriptional regulator